MSKWKGNIKIGSIVMNIEKLYEALINLAYKKITCPQGQRNDYLKQNKIVGKQIINKTL